jgi:hypothetical protein
LLNSARTVPASNGPSLTFSTDHATAFGEVRDHAGTLTPWWRSSGSGTFTCNDASPATWSPRSSLIHRLIRGTNGGGFTGTLRETSDDPPADNETAWLARIVFSVPIRTSPCHGRGTRFVSLRRI